MSEFVCLDLLVRGRSSRSIHIYAFGCQRIVPFGKDTVSFESYGLAVISETCLIDFCSLGAAALSACHIEVPAGILRLSLEQ